MQMQPTISHMYSIVVSMHKLGLLYSVVVYLHHIPVVLLHVYYII